MDRKGKKHTVGKELLISAQYREGVYSLAPSHFFLLGCSVFYTVNTLGPFTLLLREFKREMEKMADIFRKHIMSKKIAQFSINSLNFFKLCKTRK